jgi:hypothetical protein
MAKEREEQAATMPKGHLRHPHGQVQGSQGCHQGARKLDHSEYQIVHSSFPKSGQHLYSRELVWQAIQDSTTVKFRRSGSSSTELSSGSSLPNQATNA